MNLEWQIFWVFFKINLLSFGGVFGVLPELERTIVVEHQWLTHERFIQSYVVSQFLPGPNMAMCPLIGYWVHGWPGWVAGFLGIYSGPLLLMGLAYALLRRYGEVSWVKRLQKSIEPLVVGLVAASAARLFWLQSTDSLAGKLAALAITASGVWLHRCRKWPSLPLIFALGIAWWAATAALIDGFTFM